MMRARSSGTEKRAHHFARAEAFDFTAKTAGALDLRRLENRHDQGVLIFDVLRVAYVVHGRGQTTRSFAAG